VEKLEPALRAVNDGLAEQDAKIRKVRAEIELSRSAPQTVLNAVKRPTNCSRLALSRRKRRVRRAQGATVEAAVPAAMALDFAGDTPAATGTRHRVLLRQRNVRRHRRPIEIVVEQPIPTGKVGVSVNAHQFVIVPVNFGQRLRLFSEVETMKN